MEISTLQSLLASPSQLFAAIKAEKPLMKLENGSKKYPYEIGIQQYDPKQHDIKNPMLRPDKKVKVPSSLDDEFGKPIMTEKTVRVTRIAIPLQKHIIKQKASFAIGGKVELKPSVADSPVFKS